MIVHPFHDDDVLLEAMQRARMGDCDAFTIIYERCIVRVRRLCRCKLCWRDRVQLYEDDLASEVMVSIWRSICNASADTWTLDDLWRALCRSSTDRCFDRTKRNNRQKRKSHLELSDLFQTLYGNQICRMGTEEVDTEDLVEKLLELLPSDELREIVVDRLDGLDLNEIAIRRDVSVRTVRRKLDTVWQIFLDGVLERRY